MEKSNKKALAILGHQYTGLINQTENWDFFLGLADYVKTLESLAPTKALIEAMEKQAEVSRKLYDQFNNSALAELTRSATQMSEIAERFAKQSEPVRQAVQEMQKYINGSVISSDLLHSIDHSIFDVARRLNESGLGEMIKRFEDNNKAIQNIYGNYTFSESLQKFDNERTKLERVEQIEPWGAWQHLPITKEIVLEPDVIIEKTKEKAETDPSQKMLLWDLFILKGEMENIRTGEATDDKVVIFKLKDYKNYLQRVHNFITAQLLKADAEMKLDFDDARSILYFAGKEITISQRAQSDAHELLRTLFKDTAKEWNTDEILDDWRFDVNGNTPKKKAYHAGKAVNRIVAQETQIKDFLDVDTKKISINKRYLPN